MLSAAQHGASGEPCPGGIIDEAALAEAIENGVIAGAGVDVFASEPLAETPAAQRQRGLVLTPHLGASTEAQENVATDAAEQIRDVPLGLPPAARSTSLVSVPRSWSA